MITRRSYDRFLANLGVYETTLADIRDGIKGLPIYWTYDYWGSILERDYAQDQLDVLLAKPYEEVKRLSPVDMLTWARAKGYKE